MPTITAMELLALPEMQNRSCPNYDGVSFFSRGWQQLFDVILLVRLRSNKNFDVSVVKLWPISLIHRLWNTCATGESKTKSYSPSFPPACYIYNYLFLIMGGSPSSRNTPPASTTPSLPWHTPPPPLGRSTLPLTLLFTSGETAQRAVIYWICAWVGECARVGKKEP